MDGIIIPKTAKEAKEIKILTTEEQLRYIEASKAKPNDLFLRLALYTGMRLGEILALKRENVDLDQDQGTITIKESLKRSRVYSDDRSFIVKDVGKEPKTKKGIRLIYIPDILIGELKLLKKKKTSCLRLMNLRLIICMIESVLLLKSIPIHLLRTKLKQSPMV